MISTINARFWVHGPKGLVKLTLKPDQKLQHARSHPHEEGFHAEENIWEYKIQSVGIPYIEQFTVSWGRDCDGPHECRCRHEARIDRLQFQESVLGKIHIPQWKETSWRQRDYYAEAAGY